MPLSSNSLFHYTKGGMNALKGILSDKGFWVKYNKELHPTSISRIVKPEQYLGIEYDSENVLLGPQTIDFMGNKRHYFHIPMVSFCDIPVNSISRHLETYGKEIEVRGKRKRIGYAIGMRKQWGMKNQVTPLLYLIQGGVLSSSISSGCAIDISRLESLKVKHPTDDHLDRELYMPPLDMSRGNALKDNKGNVFQRIALYSKPIGYRIEYQGTIEYKYMDEREWRYVPNNAQIIHDLEFSVSTNHREYYYSVEHNAKRAVDEATKYPNLVFDIDDISHIIVGLDSEISEIQDYINTAYSTTPHNKLMLLYSKVTSYETLERDFFSH